jgi:hypothetical protein
MKEEQLDGERIVKTSKPCFHDKVAGDTLKILFKAINANRDIGQIVKRP